MILPSVPARPAVVFLYMYLIRLGLLDGRSGLRFCFFHAWYQAAVDALAAEASRPGRRDSSQRPRPAGAGSRGRRMPDTRHGSTATAARAGAPPRLGVLASHPIQYQAPLYQELRNAAGWILRSPSSATTGRGRTTTRRSASR